MFKDHGEPDIVPDVHHTRDDLSGDRPRKLSQWVVLLGLAASNRAAARDVKSGAIKIDGVVMTEDREFTGCRPRRKGHPERKTEVGPAALESPRGGGGLTHGLRFASLAPRPARRIRLLWQARNYGAG